MAKKTLFFIIIFSLLSSCATAPKATISTPREEPSVKHAISGAIGTILTIGSILTLSPSGIAQGVMGIPLVVDDFEKVKHDKKIVPTEETNDLLPTR